MFVRASYYLGSSGRCGLRYYTAPDSSDILQLCIMPGEGATVCCILFCTPLVRIEGLLIVPYCKIHSYAALLHQELE